MFNGRVAILSRYGVFLLTATMLSGAFGFFPVAALAAVSDGRSAQTTPAATNEPPIDLEAETIIHDEARQTVTAKGNVELVQAGRIVKADAITYNLSTEEVHATGNVVMSEADGTTYFADDVELTSDMKNGFVESLMILLTDGSRFTAQEGTRKGGTVVELKQASYTPCEPCKEDPSKSPVWQLRAKEVTHDEGAKTISYRDAWFELAGVPIAYTPYFSHPDGSEKQKSGFLTPTMGFDSQLGAAYQQEYYWAIAPDKDATIGAIVATDVNPVALAEYRQRFQNAEIKLNGSATYSERTDSVAGVSRDVGDEWRGHLFGNGQWDMNEKWRSGFNVAVTSDDQYLRQYNIERKNLYDFSDTYDVLENEVYVERFSDRDYMVGRVLAFQDVRVSTRQVEQPGVLPEVIASFYGDPNGLLGGRWNGELSALGLYRDGNGQDVLRGSGELGWQRRYVTGFGLVNKFDASLRGDIYNIGDRANSVAGHDFDDTLARGFAQVNWEASYPFVKSFSNAQMLLEPVVSLTSGTNVDFDDGVPNEDSQDFTLDATNIFEANRFPGYDLVEDRSRITYGMRAGLFGDNGNRGEIFLGQSRRFEDADNPFPVGSGLSEQNSDYVGQITAALGSSFNFNYRAQFDQETLASKRHEVDAGFSWDRLSLAARYYYGKGLNGTDLDLTREQISPYVSFRLHDQWYVSGSVWYDLGEDQGLRQAYYGVSYIGQCVNLSLMTERKLTDRATGDSSTEIMLRIGLKNLGEFESSGISLGGSGE